MPVDRNLPHPAVPRSDYQVDLQKLAMVDPQAAQAGYQVNAPEHGGANHDGNALILTGDEFQAAAPLLSARPDLWRPIERLQHAFEPRPGAEASAGSKPQDWTLNPRVRRLLEIDLGRPQDPTRGLLVGEFALAVQDPTAGPTRLRFAVPTQNDHQSVYPDALQILVVDRDGREVPGLLSAEVKADEAAGESKRVLDITVDPAALPQPAYLAFSFGARFHEQPVDLAPPVPLSALRTPPRDAERWLQPTPFAQSDHPEIRAKAEAISARATTVQGLVRETLAEMQRLREGARPPVSQQEALPIDALSMVRTGVGVCTTNANLFAALMRANGVPTRVVACVLRGSTQQMHFRNEYLVPGKGWAYVEPQGLELQTPRNTAVHVGVITPELEKDTANPFYAQHFGEEVEGSGRPVDVYASAVTSSGAVFSRGDAMPYFGMGVTYAAL